MALLALSVFVDLEKGDGNHLLEHARSKAEGHGNERIITAGRSNSVQFILNSLPSLIALSSYFVDRILDGFLLCTLPGCVGIFQELFYVVIIALLCVRSKDLVHLRHGKAAVLLCSGAEDDIAHDIKCGVECLRLVVPDISHLETAF